MNALLHTALLPLLQAQHVCFGHQIPTDEACKICLVRDLCVQHKERLLAEFAQDWERFQRVGEDSDYISLSTPAPCGFCRKMMRPEEGKVLHVLKKGTYHTWCVDLAFPSPT